VSSRARLAPDGTLRSFQATGTATFGLPIDEQFSIEGTEARMEREADTVVESNGERLHLAVYAITGLELNPVRIWLDDRGAFFGLVDPWFSCIRAGWEGSIDRLHAIQKTLQARREQQLAERFARRPPEPGLAFVHARVFDADKKAWLADHTVVVQGERIVELYAKRGYDEIKIYNSVKP
jgi:hypothetical protein